MKYIYATLILILLAGCGNTSDTSVPLTQESSTLKMIIGQEYSVKKGDKLVKTSTDAKVSIVKNIQDDSSTVILLEGSANIIRL